MKNKIFFFSSFSLLSFFLFSQTLPTFKGKEKKAKEFFKKGIIHLNKKNYSLSSEYLLKSTIEKPNFYLAQKLLADSYYLNGKWLESLNILSSLNQKEYRFVNKFLVDSRINYLKFNLADIEQKKNQNLTYYSNINLLKNKLYRCLNPTDIQMDKKDNLFVLCFGNSSIVRFNSNEKPVENIFSIVNNFEGSLFFKIYENKFYISNFKKDQIFIFNQFGKLIDTLGKSGKQNGEFHGPSGIDISSQGYIYIADSYNNRIQQFDLKKSFIREFGKDILKNPSGLYLSKKNEIFVVDRGNNRVVIFDKNGFFLYQLSHNEISKPRDVFFHKDNIFISDEKKGIFIYNLKDKKWKIIDSFIEIDEERKSYFLNPFGVYVSSKDTLYVSELLNHTIRMYSWKNEIFSNLNVFIENINVDMFPRVDIIFKVKNHRNQFISGLLDSDFFIFENENRVPIKIMDNMQSFEQYFKTDIIFEKSKEVQNQEYLYRVILIDLYKKMLEKDKIGFLQVGKDIDILKNVEQGKVKDLELIQIKNIENHFVFGKAIYQSLSNLTNFIGSRSILLFVSGKNIKDSFSHFDISRIIFYAKAHDIPIHILSLTEKGKQNEIYKEIAKKTNGYFINIKEDISNIDLDKLLRSSQEKRYIISYESILEKRNIYDYFIPVKVIANYKKSRGIGESGYFIK